MSLQGGRCSGELADAVSSLAQLVLGVLVCSVGRVELGTQLLDLSGKDVRAALGGHELVADAFSGALLFLQLNLHFSCSGLVLLGVLLGLGAPSVCAVQGNLELVDVALKLLLLALSLASATSLTLQGGLYVLNCTLVGFAM